MDHRRLPRLSWLAIGALLACAGCGDDDGQDPPIDAAIAIDSARQIDGGPLPEVMRFAIEVQNDIPESIYVQLNLEDGQPAWVVASMGGERVYFDERCDIEDCVDPSGVCGAALPQVRDITGGDYTGSIELFWAGETSVLDEVDGCERRELAPPGDYVAQFCFSLQAMIEGPGDPTDAVPGRLIDPVCVDQPFSPFVDDEVVYQILGG